jgi:hypothetical protein
MVAEDGHATTRDKNLAYYISYYICFGGAISVLPLSARKDTVSTHKHTLTTTGLAGPGVKESFRLFSAIIIRFGRFSSSII